MARDPEQTSVDQDALIIANPESGQFAVHDFEASGVVDLTESRLHLLNTLALFGAINQRENFYRYQSSVAQQRYGENAPQVLEGAKRNGQEMAQEAQEEFYRAIGRNLVMASAPEDYPEFDFEAYGRDAKRQWTTFQARYRREAHSSARHELMKALRSGIMLDVSGAHRDAEVRPYISKKDQKRDRTSDGREYPLLSSRERLQALQDDPRAGFLPKNDREKIKCFTYLDYLDNPEYPLGISNQFIEIFIHQQKGRKIEKLATAQRSVVSVTHELHDHWRDSLQSMAQLTKLQQDLDGANPKLGVLEDVPADHPGIPVLVRYRDLATLRDAGRLPEGIVNPLRVVEDRRPHADPTKNKTVADVYTAANKPPQMEGYITKAADGMTIAEARTLLKAAIQDEQAREAFLSDRMGDLAETAPDRRSLMIRDLASRLISETQQAS